MFRKGDTCVIIKSFAGDEGAIVTFEGYVSGPIMLGSLCWNKLFWDVECDCIVTAQGTTLHAVNILGSVECYRTRPQRSAWLRKLTELEEDEKETIEVTA